MVNIRTTLTLIGLACLAASSAWAEERNPPAYLAAPTAPHALSFLPPPPAPDSLEGKADRSIFEATRSLKDTPRWKLAQSDDDLSVPAIMKSFSCAFGHKMNAQSAPALTRLLERARSDALGSTGEAKYKYARPRPFAGTDAPICDAMRETIRSGGPGAAASAGGGPSYPSGHSTLGWTVALILAEVAPDRTGPLVARARSYGESRVVCGVHYVTDIEAGRVVGSAVFGALQSSPAFKVDLDAARAEFAAQQGPMPPAAECASIDAFSAERPY